MKPNRPLREVVKSHPEHWDHGGTPIHVRKNFSKVADCGTGALGAEVFASATETKFVYHTCKSRFCPSCGVRATQFWQQEIEAALPDIPYVNINLTMPDVLWPYFQKHPGVLHDLSGIAADAIMYWASSRFGVRLFVMVVPQTFGGLLNFHPHLHVLVSAGGLREGEARWIPRLRFDKEELMACWRFALTAYLGRLADVLSDEPEQLKKTLKDQYARKWNVFVSLRMSKAKFVRYAGRYLRRPPIAEYRLTRISEDEIEYVGKNTRQNQRERMRFATVRFLETLMQHVPQHYSHAVRYFGLLAPRTKNRIATGILRLLEQKRRSRPRPLTWAQSIKKSFGIDPLLDSKGQTMRRVGRLLPGNAKSPIVTRTCALE